MAKGCLLIYTCAISFSVKKKKNNKGFARPTGFLMPYLPSNKVNSELDVCSVSTSPEGSETGCFNLFFFLPSFFFFRFLSPLNMLIGGTVVVLVFMGFVWVSHNKDILRRMKKQYPTTFVIVIMLSSYFLISYLGDVMVFMFGITLPLLCK